MRLSRRDRAALVLALEWARTVPGRGGGMHIAVDEATRVLWVGRDACRLIATVFARSRDEWLSAYSRSSRTAGEYERAVHHARRLLRARLALLLRAVLRADAGDYGRNRPTCTRCGAQSIRPSAPGPAPVGIERVSRTSMAPGEVEELLDEAEFFVAQGLFEEARGLLSDALNTHPRHPDFTACEHDRPSGYVVTMPSGGLRHLADAKDGWSRRITPLWQLAPEHRP